MPDLFDHLMNERMNSGPRAPDKYIGQEHIIGKGGKMSCLSSCKRSVK